MLLDQLEGVEIADPLIERGRSPDVGEQQPDVADREALRATDHLGAEQALERLAGEQVLAGEIGGELQERVLVSWSRLQDAENAAARRGVLDLEHDRPRGERGPVRLILGAEIGQAQPLRLGAALGPDLQHEPGVGVRAGAEERSLRCLEREGGGSAGFQKPQPAQRVADRVEIGLAVRPVPLAHAFEHEHVVERVERLRTLVAGRADLGRDVEVDRDEVIHRRFVLVVTLRAAEAAQDGAQAGEALDRAGAARADQQPVHLEQPERRRVQEQVDRLVRSPGPARART